jgi:hypothetical protein
MPQPTLEIDGISVVMVGNLNPAIFHPAWFAAEALIDPTLADSASVRVIHPDAAVFSLDWVDLLVTRDRFQLSTELPDRFNALRDLAMGTFEKLAHTPLWTVGINKDSHYRFPDETSLKRACDALAPIQLWRESLTRPNLKNIVVEADRSDGRLGYIHVKVEPSSEVENGLYVNVNDHFQFNESREERPHSAEILELLATEWEKSLGRARRISSDIVALHESKK